MLYTQKYILLEIFIILNSDTSDINRQLLNLINDISIHIKERATKNKDELIIIKKNIEKIKDRINDANIEIENFTKSELKYYHLQFAKEFYQILYLDDFKTFIEDKVRELEINIESIQIDLKTNSYKFNEDSEFAKSQLFDSIKYKKYLECVIQEFNNIEYSNINNVLFKSVFGKSNTITEDEYLQKWVDKTVTLSEWQRFKKINILEELKYLEIKEEEIEDIMQHKFNLFNKLKSKILQNRFIEPFNNIFPFEDKIITAKRDLDLIENLIEGNIDEIKDKRLKEILQIKDWKTTATHFDHIYRHKYKNEANYDIHDPDSFLDAHVILDYKSFLNDYLQKNENEINTTAHIYHNTKNTTYKISNTNIKHKSFKYTNNDSTRLPDLMNALIKANFIDKETEIKQFRKIFSGNEIDKQIIWIGNISELSYFIKTIHNVHRKIDDTKQKIWEITSKCFIQSDGKPYDKSKFRGQKKPANNSIIDKIVKIL